MIVSPGSTQFGPNAEVSFSIELIGSHRDSKFKSLYRETTSEFQRQFGLDDYDILFLPGGGTLGIEAVMASSISPIEVAGCEGVFRGRWREMASIYNAEKTGNPKQLSCHVETSVSTHQELGTPILDVVSSFPYFDVPATCDVFVLASNKQLGSLAGLAIVGVRKEKFENYFRGGELSYLSLRRYLDASMTNELPSTVGTYLFDALLKSLRTFDKNAHRSNMNSVCDEIVDFFGADSIVGDHRGPVITVLKEAIPARVAAEWNLYEKSTPHPSYQFFTYSAPKARYTQFLEAVTTGRHQ